MAIGKITSKSLAADAVTSANLAPGAVTISDIPDGEITADKINTTLDLSTKTLTLTQASVTAHQAALSITQSQISDLSTTSDLAEGTNLYYTDVRADARITASNTDALSEGTTNLYYTDARADARAALLVDSAPGTLDTLNELAAALGDDPNFATTTATNIATKLPLAGGTLTGNVTFGDNNKAIFGAGSALQIYHDGSNNYVDAAGVGHLYLQSQGTDKDVKIQSDDGAGGLTEYFRADGSIGQAQMFYYGSIKLATTSTGIDVKGSGVPNITLTSSSGPYSYIESNTVGSLGFAADEGNTGSATNINFRVDGNEIARLNGGSFVVNDGSRDIDFRVESNNNTHALFVDAGTNFVGIGVSVPDRLLHLAGTGGSSANIVLQRTGSGLTTQSRATVEAYNNSGNSMGGISFNAAGDDDSGEIDFYVTGDNSADANIFSLSRAANFQQGLVHFNPDGGDNDFRVESDNITHALFVRGSDGNVGIGTTSPADPLNVATSTNGSPTRIRLTANDATGVSRNGSIFFDPDNNTVGFRNGGTNRLSVDPSGNVGIGVALPATALDVNGIIKIGNAGTSASAAGAGAVKYDNVLQISDGTDWKAVRMIGQDGSSSANAFDDLAEVAGLYSSDTGLWTTVQGYVSGGLQYTVDFTTPFTPKYQASNSNSGVYDTSGNFSGCSQGTGTGWTVWDAASYCMRGGARLCSLTELDANVVGGSGCSHDNRAIWTYTTDSNGHFYRGAGINSNSTNEGYVVGTNTSPTGYSTNEIGIRCCGTSASGGALWEI